MFIGNQIDQLKSQIIVHKFFSDRKMPGSNLLSQAYGEITKNSKVNFVEPLAAV